MMTSDTRQRLAAVFDRASAVASVGSVAFGVTALLLGLLDGERRGPVPLLAPPPETALAFVLAGAALWLFRHDNGRPRSLRSGLALSAGLAVLGAAAFGAHWLLWTPSSIQPLVPPAARMAPETSFAFLLIGLALCLLCWRDARIGWPVQLLALATLVGAGVILAGYVLVSPDAPGLRDRLMTPTVLMLAVVSLGVLLARPNAGPVAVFASEDLGGAAARRLLPLAVAAALLPSLLRACRLGGLEEAAAWRMATAATLGVFVLAAWWIGRFVSATLRARDEAGAVDRRQEADVRELFENALDVMYRTRLDGAIEMVSPSVSRYGFTARELIGSDVRILYLDPRERDALVNALLEKGTVNDMEVTLRRADGRAVPAAASARMRRDAGGRPLGVEGVLRDISDRKLAETRLRRHSRQQAGLARLGQLALTARELPALFRSAVDLAAEGLGADYALLRQLDVRRAKLYPIAAAGWGYAALDDADMSTQSGTEASHALGAGGAVLIEDLAGETRFRPPGFLVRHGVRSGLSVPIRGEGGPFGVISAHSLRPGTFVADDVHFLEAVAHILGEAIHRSSAEAMLTERAMLAALGAEVGATLTRGSDLPSTLQACADVIAGRFESSLVRLWTVAEEGEGLESAAVAGAEPPAPLPHRRVRIGETVIGAIAADLRQRHGSAVEVGAGQGEQAWMSRERLEAFSGYPLVVDGRLVGVLALFTRAPLSRVAQRALGAVADEIALGVQHRALAEARQEEAQVSSALARVGRELIAALDPPTLLDHLCRPTAGVLDCERSHTFLLEGVDHFAPVASYGESAERWETMRLLEVPRSAVGPLLERLEGDEVAALGTAGDAALGRFWARPGGLAIALQRGGVLLGFQTAIFAPQAGAPARVQMRIARGISHLASLALEHVQVVRELENANRLKSDFVATMSHELRTPLNIILGYGDLLLEGQFGALREEQRQVLERLQGRALELHELISATLDLSRLESGRTKVVLRPTEVASLVRELAAEIAPSAPHRPVHLVWRPVPANLWIETDAAKLKVALKNVVANGLKFTDDGVVVVAVSGRDGGVEFAVSDTGIGMAPEAAEVIFEAFRQGEDASDRQSGGVGLGLYVVRQLLDLLGGSVSVESAPGRGSTFRLWVPERGKERAGR